MKQWELLSYQEDTEAAAAQHSLTINPDLQSLVPPLGEKPSLPAPPHPQSGSDDEQAGKSKTRGDGEAEGRGRLYGSRPEHGDGERGVNSVLGLQRNAEAGSRRGSTGGGSTGGGTLRRRSSSPEVLRHRAVWPKSRRPTVTDLEGEVEGASIGEITAATARPDEATGGGGTGTEKMYTGALM